MPTPSNKYSEIGDFVPGESGWWYGKAGDNPGLKKLLSDLGVDVIHRADSSEMSEYTPEPGTALYTEDEEELYLGDGDNWNEQDTWGRAPVFDEIAGVASRIVTSTAELESVFSGGLEAGDTVFIAAPDTPYRTTTWLDIDVDNVTVIGESTHAGNDEPMIKIADGAHVGGFRIGQNYQCENVQIENVGVHGNTNNQAQDANRLHGIVADQVKHCTIRGCYATRLNPYHKHGTGGSGITARRTSEYVTIANNWVDDTGDRGIQVAGDQIQVTNNVCTNGYDRSIAMSVSENPTGNDPGNYFAKNVEVIGNIGYNNSAGSIIGGGGDPTGDANPGAHGRWIIANNIGFGDHRSLMTLFAPVEELIVVGNYGEGGNVDGIEVGRDRADQAAKRVVVANNVLRGYGSYGDGHHGITVENKSAFVSVTGNQIHGQDKIGIRVINPYSHHINIVGNNVSNPGSKGIELASGAGRAAIGANSIDGSGGHGIHVMDGGAVACGIVGNVITGGSGKGVVVGGGSGGGGGANVVGNIVRRKANHGIYHDIASISNIVGNVLDSNSQSTVGTKSGVVVQSGRANVVANLVMGSTHQYGIMESGTTGPSQFVANYIDDWNGGSYSGPWKLQHPGTTVEANRPAFDYHRGLSPGSGTVTVSFGKPYAQKPKLDVVTEAVAMHGVTSWGTDGSGNYTSATLSFENASGAVNPTTHVDVIGRE